MRKSIQERYYGSEKNRARAKRYRHSEKGKAAEIRAKEIRDKKKKKEFITLSKLSKITICKDLVDKYLSKKREMHEG